MKALLVSPLGFVIGVSLGALGGGGSVLAVPLLVFGAGQSPAAATTASLLIVGIASTIGALSHWRAGRVDVRQGTLFGLVGIGGSITGSLLNRALNGHALLTAFSVLMLVAAWRIVTGCPSCTAKGEQQALAVTMPHDGASASGSAPRVLTVIAAGTAVGFLTGLFGVGGGFVIVPALALSLGFSMPMAVGTSLLVIVINTVAALAARLGAPIEWSVALPFAATATAGVLTGKRVADRISAEVMQRWFAGLLVGVALYTGARGVLGLI